MHTSHPILDIMSGQNVGFLFADARIGPFSSVCTIFKLHAVRILQRAWRARSKRRAAPTSITPPRSPTPPPDTTHTTTRRAAPILTTPATQRKTASHSHFSATTTLPRQGMLSVFISQAKFGESRTLPHPLNTFVVFALPAGIGEPQATKICYSTFNPIWNHSYCAPITLDAQTVATLHSPHKYISFEIWNKSQQGGKEIHIGSAELPLKYLFTNVETPARIQLEIFPATNNAVGVLEVEVSVNPFSSADATSPEWVVNTLTKFRHVSPDPYSQEQFFTSSDDETHTAQAPSTKAMDASNASQTNNATSPKRATNNYTKNAEWAWLTDLDKELSTETDVILRNRHAKNMLELDLMLNQLMPVPDLTSTKATVPQSSPPQIRVPSPPSQTPPQTPPQSPPRSSPLLSPQQFPESLDPFESTLQEQPTITLTAKDQQTNFRVC